MCSLNRQFCRRKEVRGQRVATVAAADTCAEAGTERGLLAIKERKEELLIQQLEYSRKQEERSALECEALPRQVEEL
uniref:MADS-box protein 9 n=1 Tax=Solanum tuberosum TaxID=4113 RepID=M1DT77_SOLTU